MSIRAMIERAAETAPVGTSGGYGELVTTFAAVALVAHRLAAILKDVKPEVVAGAKAWRERLEVEVETAGAREQLVAAVGEIAATQTDILEAIKRLEAGDAT